MLFNRTKHMFSYRSLLKQAWGITWKNKYLWFLGIFASLVGGGSAWGYQILSQNLNQGLINGSYYQLSNILAIGDLMRNFSLGIIALFHSNILVVMSIASVLLSATIILVVFIWLAITSQAGLINDVKKILKFKKNDSPLTIRRSLTVGNHHFWSVLGLNLIIKILIAAIFFIVSLPLLFLVIQNINVLAIIYIILFVIFVPISVGLSLMINYAIAYKVLDNRSFVASLEKGTKLFIKNWLVSLEIGIILFIISFIASILAILLLIVFLLPLFLLGLILNLSWLALIAILLAIVIIIIFGAILTTFRIATWTSLFLRLENKGVIAKLERLFNRRNSI